MKDEELKKLYKDQLEQIGLKCTLPRLLLISELQNASNPLSAKELTQSLAKRQVDQATVYRNLEQLESKGLIKKVNLRHDHHHYEPANLKHHHHAVCTSCGKTVKLNICPIKPKAGIAKQAGFSLIADHALEFFGLCKNCKK